MGLTSKIGKRLIGGFVMLSVINYMITIFIDNLNIEFGVWIWDLSRFLESLIIFFLSMLMFTLLYGIKTMGVN